MQKYYPHFIFLLLASVCIGFGQGGYLFLLDDNLYLQNFDWAYEKFFQFNGAVLRILVDRCNHIIPGWITQRLIYIGTLFALGLGGYTLSSKLFPGKYYGAYFAGIFAMINPRVYGRVMDGQIFIPLSLAAILWGISFLLTGKSFLQKSFYSGVLFALAIRCTSHSVFFVAAIFLIYFCCSLEMNMWRSLCGQILVSGLTILMFNLHWLLPMALGGKSEFAIMQSFDDRHIQAFASNPGNTNVYLSTAGGFGFWGEKQGRFMTIQATSEKAWLLLFAMIFVLVIFGSYTLYQKKHYSILGFFVALGVVSYILGIGVSHATIFASVTQWFYDYIPMYIGLREPQKRIGLLMIVYAIVGGFGVQRLIEEQFSGNDIRDRGMQGFLLMLPLLYTPFQLFAGRGQLEARHYPQDWYALKQSLDTSSECIGEQNPCYDILVFPWHMYQSFHFTHGVIAHPLPNFFKHQKLLGGDNMEMPGIYTQSSRPESKIIEKYIGPKGEWSGGNVDLTGSLQQFYNDIVPLQIHHILLLKEVDYMKYLPYLEQGEKIGLFQKEQETSSYMYYRILQKF